MNWDAFKIYFTDYNQLEWRICLILCESKTHVIIYCMDVDTIHIEVHYNVFLKCIYLYTL